MKTDETETSFDFFRDLHAAQNRVISSFGPKDILPFKEGLQRGIDLVLSCQKSLRKLIFIGNGGSAAIASHQSVDYWKNGGVSSIAFNDASLLTCIANDYGYERVFAEPVSRFADEGDLLIAISSSGKSANILNAVEVGRTKGCRILTLSGFAEDNPLRTKGSLNFYVPSFSYGVVEVTHLSVLHAMLDQIIESKKTRL